MFLGGPKEETAELRTPSLKGLLRFWARAALGTTDGDLKLLGSTSGRSRVALRAKWVQQNAGHKGTVFPQDLAYLWYGPCGYDWILNANPPKKGQVATRAHFQPGSVFEIIFALSSNDAEPVVKAGVWALVYLGGVGSRSRRGSGALTIDSVAPEWSDLKFTGAGSDLPGYLRRRLASMQARSLTAMPTYSALWSGARIFVSDVNKPFKSAEEALAEFAKRMKAFRHKDNRGKGTKGADYHRVKGAMSNPLAWSRSSKHEVPHRLKFGLPNNYTSRSRTAARQHPWQINFEPKHYDRRASPLSVTVNAAADGYLLTLVDWRCQFLPQNEPIVAYIPPHPRGADGAWLKKKDSPLVRSVPTTDPVADFLSQQSDFVEVK